MLVIRASFMENEVYNIRNPKKRMDYLKARTDYRIALRRWMYTSEKLSKLLNTDLCGIEELILNNAIPPLLRELVAEYVKEGAALDAASNIWDDAQDQQALELQKAKEQINQDLLSIEC